MSARVDCMPCYIRQAIEAVTFCESDDARRAEIVRRVLAALAQADWDRPAPALGQIVHRVIRRETGNPDPYRAMKGQMNRLALELLPQLVDAACLEEEPRTAFLRLALAGNLLDTRAKTGRSAAEVRTALGRAGRGECLRGAVCDVWSAVQRARRILYVTDNAGEIVFDRALIERWPVDRITVGVRGAPVINDATLTDAEEAGLTGLVPVLPNGSDAPGILLDDCSPEFQCAVEASDLIIAKGQGNFESLVDTGQHAFFLLQVKCACVAADVGLPVGTMAVCERLGPAGPMKVSALS